MSPRASATAYELSRAGLLSGLPGERLAELARRMERIQVSTGTTLVREGDEQDDRFFVLLSGLLAVSQQTRGPQRILRPGECFGEVALAVGVPRTASVSALTPATLAVCDKETFDEFVRPLFADD